MSNYQQHPAGGGHPADGLPYAQQPPRGWARQDVAPQGTASRPAPVSAGKRRLLGPVNWRVVRISIPIIVLVEGLVLALAWPAISRQIHPSVAVHTLTQPANVTVRDQALKMVPPTADDRPGTDAETNQTGRNKQFLGLVRLNATYSPDGRLGTPPGYQVFAGYGTIKDPAARMDQAIANIKVIQAQQLGPMLQFSARGKNAGDVPIRCTGIALGNGNPTTIGWCTWANRSTIGTVTLISNRAAGPSANDLSNLADDTASLRDQMYAAP